MLTKSDKGFSLSLLVPFLRHHIIISHQENVREEFQKKGGVIDLKKKIFSSLLKENDLNIDTSSGVPPHVERKLRRTKVLLVLDDISDSSELENLVGKLDCFKLSSRIIITTRDKDVLKGVAKGVAIKTYEVKPLTFDEALELFNLHAFEENCMDTELHALSRMVIEYARQLPLAVKVMGSFLRDKNKQEWKSQMEKLRKMPFKKVHDILRLSYDTLDRQQKDVFLYIVCHFKWYRQWRIISILDACGFSTIIELKVLRDKALITWTSEKSIVSMHDLIEEMGKEIVREESMQDLGKYRHLWDSNDICEVLRNNKGTEYIQSINLNRITGGSNLLLTPRVFSRMHKLKILEVFPVESELLLRPEFFSKMHKLELPEDLESLPDELRFLYWTCYPLEYLPLTCAKNLFELQLPISNLRKLWEGVVPLENLRKLVLSWSVHLVELPDLSLAKNLEEVVLIGCENLRVVHRSIFSLPKLWKLDLTSCGKLSCLRSFIHLHSLSDLRLYNCQSLKKFLVISKNMIQLNLSFTAIKELPLSIGLLGRLEDLKLVRCENLTHLPSNLVDLTSLCSLNISGCDKLQSLPQLPPSIQVLQASGCTSLKIVQFPITDGIPLNKSLACILLENCVKLDGNSRNAIGLIADPNLTNYALNFSFSEEHKHLRVDGKFIYPGWQVPKWFKHRTQQGSITIALHSKLLGFIFCMILRQDESPKVDLFLENKNGERLNLYDMNGYTDDLLTSDAVLIPDDDECLYSRRHHVHICYTKCSELINERIEESNVRHQNPMLSFEFHGWKMGELIRKCGVHPIYAKEFEVEELENGNKSKRSEDVNEFVVKFRNLSLVEYNN